MLNTMNKLRKREKVLIVCTGDSITEQNYHVHGHLNYAGQLSEKLIDTFGRTSFVFNTGVSGQSTWGAVPRLHQDVLRFQPDLVTFMYGINDSKMGKDGIPDFKRNLESCVEAVREAGSEIVLLTQNVIVLDTNEEAVVQRQSYPEYVTAIREVAALLQVPLCDIYSKWSSLMEADPQAHSRMMDDTLHPNEQGHRFMARTLFDYLELG
ncbi:MAG: lipase/acylhydrolase [Paenibacillus sp.]|nr:lipase/acylhydrolase [Paenibacillus sp.]